MVRRGRCRLQAEVVLLLDYELQTFTVQNVAGWPRPSMTLSASFALHNRRETSWAAALMQTYR